MSKISPRLLVTLALLVILQLTVLVHSSSLREYAKNAFNKVSDAVDKTQPEHHFTDPSTAETTGGVRATVLHTGANLVMEKALGTIGNKYPGALPLVRTLSGPLLNTVHERINHFRSTTPVPTDGAPKAEQVGEKKPAGEEKKDEAEVKKSVKPEEKADDKNDEKAEEIDDKKGDKKKGDKKKRDKKEDTDQEKGQSKTERKVEVKDEKNDEKDAKKDAKMELDGSKEAENN